MTFDDFESMEVVHRSEQGFVYVLCWKQDDKEVPFYVGQTQAIWGRMNDYHWGQFQASTDFRIGQAIRYLSERNLRVVSRYKQVDGTRPDWRRREAQMIKELETEGWLLLNSMASYRYLESNEDLERSRVEGFMEQVRKNATTKLSSR